jgi:hypothetical protein
MVFKLKADKGIGQKANTIPAARTMQSARNEKSLTHLQKVSPQILGSLTWLTVADTASTGWHLQSFIPH